MAHSTRRNNQKLTELDLDPSLLLRRKNGKSNTSSPPAVGPSSADNGSVGTFASIYENRLTFRLDEARCAATELAEKNKTVEDEKGKEMELPEYPPSVDEENVSILLRCSEL